MRLCGFSARDRAKRLGLMPFAVAALCLAASVQGQIPVFVGVAAPATKSEPPTFSPETETKLAEFFKKVDEARRKALETRMRKQIEAVAKVTGLSADSRKALDAPAVQAIDESLKEWDAKSQQYFRRQWGQNADQLFQVLDQFMRQLPAFAKQAQFGEFTTPEETPVWKQNLEKTLNADQAAAWEKVRKEEHDALEKEIDQYLKPITENIRTSYSDTLLNQGTAVNTILKVSKETQEKLDKLAKSVADKMVDVWRAKAVKALFTLDEDDRRLAFKNGNFYVESDESDMAKEKDWWKDGLAKVLSAEDYKRLEAVREGRRAKQAGIMAHIVLSELDQKVAFTSAQRQQVQPIVDRLIREDPALVPKDDNMEGQNNRGLQPLLAAAGKATEAELKPILEPVQWKHWQEACDPKNNTNQRVYVSPAARQDPKAKEPVRDADPEDFERELSNFLYEKSLADQKRTLNALMLKAEDATRVAGLSAETTSRLETAARGATEKAMASWRDSVDQMVRSNLGTVEPAKIKQRLAGLGPYMFQQNVLAMNTPTIWEAAVKRELTEAQQKAWQVETDARSEARDKTISQAVLAEFDREVPLSEEQWSKFEPIISGIIKEYGPSINRMFSNAYNYPWYVQQYYAPIPFAGVPEKDFKAILSKEQIEHWTASNVGSNSANWWSNIKSNHENEMKQKKK